MRLATGPHGCAQILDLGRQIVTRGDGPDQLHLKGVIDCAADAAISGSRRWRLREQLTSPVLENPAWRLANVG
jgi:hypothetical protein